MTMENPLSLAARTAREVGEQAGRTIRSLGDNLFNFNSQVLTSIERGLPPLPPLPGTGGQSGTGLVLPKVQGFFKSLQEAAPVPGRRVEVVEVTKEVRRPQQPAESKTLEL